MFHSNVEYLRKCFRSGKTQDVQIRKQQLSRIIDMLRENKDDISDALFQDFHKARSESYAYEILFVINEARDAIYYLDSWAKKSNVSRNLLQVFDSAYIVKQPLGVVLIISPWNYPIQLLLAPLIGAIAAGNCVVVKPSEHTPITSKLLESLFQKYLDPEIVHLINGGIEETGKLLEEKFDHIFFTGSSQIGKHILKAASETLTPVTLELGGKCPAIVDKNADIHLAAKRIIWGKLIASGQTCLAPNYVFCHKSMKSALIDTMRQFIIDSYGQDPKESQDYCRIINRKNFDRIISLIDPKKVVFGGTNDAGELYIAPTILDYVKIDDPILKEEIFGPVLPILTYESLDSVIDFVNNDERPLAVYLFSKDQKLIDSFLRSTHSGGVTINDVIMHCALENLPFGGVGNSGMGRYHGKFSFDCFSHKKAVLHRPFFGEPILWMRYPPYTESKMRFAELLMTRRSVLFRNAALFCFPVLAALVALIFVKIYY